MTRAPWLQAGTLLLEDGEVFDGLPFGCQGVALGEAVFSTGMAGYQEAISDPSYARQILCLTVPHVGNYGVNPEDVESRRPHLAGFVVTSLPRLHSNWRARGTLEDFLRAHGVPALEQVDTRRLVRHLRAHGTLRAAIATDGTPVEELKRRLEAWEGIDRVDLTREVSVTRCARFALEPEEVPPFSMPRAGRELRVAALDLGMKRNIVRNLAWRGCRVMVFPAASPARDLLDAGPDGVFLSNGPGNPAMAEAAVETVGRLLEERDLPIFGICLGHQVLALAAGARTHRLPFGHRGTNHPVLDIASGRVWITSQNHGYTVDAGSLPAGVEVTHLSLHDRTVEGVRWLDRPVFAVQFHPEASPGPRDALSLFDRFIEAMEERDAR